MPGKFANLIVSAKNPFVLGTIKPVFISEPTITKFLIVVPSAEKLALCY